jgi:N-acetylmuramoyl-L-alanine amidase
MDSSNIIQRSSSNFDCRCGKQKPEMLIIHYTGMADNQEAIKRLCNPGSRVSAHYVIDDVGRCFQLVDESYRAWHAGVSSWAGNNDINSCSIGIELCNPGHEHGYKRFPKKQIATLLGLGKDILARHSILPQFVLGHSDVAPTRKLDPGEFFDWRHLANNGIGIWPATNAATNKQTPEKANVQMDDRKVARIQGKLAHFGYGIKITGTYDEQSTLVVMAFQRHFRQNRITGVLDAESEFILDNLLVQVG